MNTLTLQTGSPRIDVSYRPSQEGHAKWFYPMASYLSEQKCL